MAKHCSVSRDANARQGSAALGKLK
jgi:hypothetical protein